MAHGTADQVVKYGFGKKSKQLLKDWGWDVRWRKYKGLAHDFRHDEGEDVLTFLTRTLAPPPRGTGSKGEL